MPRHEVHLPIKVLCTFSERLKGLLFAVPHCMVVVLVPCSCVHTWFMRYELDIAFLDKTGQVLSSYRSVKTMRLLRNKNASCVLERFADPNAYWPEKGERYFWGLLRESFHESAQDCRKRALQYRNSNYSELGEDL